MGVLKSMRLFWLLGTTVFCVLTFATIESGIMELAFGASRLFAAAATATPQVSQSSTKVARPQVSQSGTKVPTAQAVTESEACPRGSSKVGEFCVEIGRALRGCANGTKKICFGPTSDEICFCKEKLCKPSRAEDCPAGFVVFDEWTCKGETPFTARARCPKVYQVQFRADGVDGIKCARGAPAVRNPTKEEVVWVCPYGSKVVGKDSRRMNRPLCASTWHEDAALTFCPRSHVADKGSCYVELSRKEVCDEGYSIKDWSVSKSDPCRCSKYIKWDVTLMGCEGDFQLEDGRCVRYLTPL